METTNAPQPVPATNNGTAPTPPPSPTDAGLAEEPGISREERVQVLAVIKRLFKRIGWDLDLEPPNDSQRPGSEALFRLCLSAMNAVLRQNPWEYQSKLRQMDRMIRRALVPLGNLLALPPAHAGERLELAKKTEAHVDQQLMDLSHQHLTPSESVRLLKLLRKREHSLRRRTEGFYKAAVKAVQKRKRKPR